MMATAAQLLEGATAGAAIAARGRKNRRRRDRILKAA
jgi:hypothetical protein